MHRLILAIGAAGAAAYHVLNDPAAAADSSPCAGGQCK
jgi:hypothetical protein